MLKKTLKKLPFSDAGHPTCLWRGRHPVQETKEKSIALDYSAFHVLKEKSKKSECLLLVGIQMRQIPCETVVANDAF
jgi:hypothetical protein